MTTLILSWSAGKCWQVEHGKISGLLLTYWLHELNVFLLLLNHGLEVNVNLDAESLVVCFTLATLLFYVVHSSTTVLSVYLQLFYLVETRGLFRECTHCLSGLDSSIAVTSNRRGIIVALVATA